MTIVRSFNIETCYSTSNYEIQQLNNKIEKLAPNFERVNKCITGNISHDTVYTHGHFSGINICFLLLLEHSYYSASFQGAEKAAEVVLRELKYEH